MDCPVDQRTLRRTTLDASLPVFECAQCAGHWLRFGDYLTWREQQPNDVAEVSVDGAEEALEQPPGTVRRCPDCGGLCTRHRVGHGAAFTLDRCGRCNGVWMDRAEWDQLRERGLHDNLQQLFGDGWQRALLREERRRVAEAGFEQRVGVDDAKRAREFRAWLAAHPRRSELMAYLQWPVRD
jgi:Zn-finger nucleic acid-binding protein